MRPHQVFPDSELCDDVLAEYFLRVDRGESIDREEFLSAHLEVAEQLRAYFANTGVIAEALFSASRGPMPVKAVAGREPSQNSTEGCEREAEPAEQVPHRIGRYRVESLLGTGGFGRVYLACDDELGRPVAIKVPHRYRISDREGQEAYLAEARVVAHLEHPGIVPVYDVGRTEAGLCFTVSKFVEGGSLQRRIMCALPSDAESADLTATVAEALHYAHLRGLVHRDIKPANILLDAAGRPYVTDFGLAARDVEPATRAPGLGTPHYMSPEQVQGEGHRVDRRTDIFALGVVLYELLTGARPFEGATARELFENIAGCRPRPLREQYQAVPAELERICLKALSKRISDRYLSAQDMADDLRRFLGGDRAEKSSYPARMRQSPLTTGAPGPLSRPVGVARVVPKGLRAFDARDAAFFLDLLPGPRDREGLPEGIRFWKGRIEETDPERAFAVGLIYGPSGCGKSSLVRAGLLPRLADFVTSLYVETTPEETEARLLGGLRRQFPQLPAGLGLKDALAALRRAAAVRGGRKVLIVLDQFEQWLHAQHATEEPELVEALRQCDGKHVQCLILVRDDFWLAISRFMRQLEVSVVEGRNSAMVDLFDLKHAQKVLSAFGRAFGALPQSASETTAEQEVFLEQACAAIAQDGKVISVRLALFAEMMKTRPWSPGSLKEVGGAEGLVMAFLAETFHGPSAPLEHRRHQRAARSVLEALLPEPGTDIKGNMRSHEELLERSGYAGRPADFVELLGILNTQLRLIAPADPRGAELEEDADSDAVSAEGRFYQLSHDYLIPSLREWLVAKDKQTRRGRARLLLADRAALWSAKPEPARLPSLPEWLNIRLFTRPVSWTDSQRRMARAATRFHVCRIGALLVIAVTLAIVLGTARHRLIRQQQADRVASLVHRLLDAEIDQVPDILETLRSHSRQASGALREALDQAVQQGESHCELRARLALLETDPSQASSLHDRMLAADPRELPAINRALGDHDAVRLDDLWRVAEDETEAGARRFRAACALATCDPGDGRWTHISTLVAEQLVSQNVLVADGWKNILGSKRDILIAPLAAIFRDRSGKRATQRILATEILADYAADRPDLLCELVLDSDHEQFLALHPFLERHRDGAIARFTEELTQSAPSGVAEEGRDVRARRQANAAVALLRLDHTELVWPLLARRPDPRLRSYLIHLFRPLKVAPERLIARWRIEADPGIRAAIVLGLGEFPVGELPRDRREALIGEVLKAYRTDPEPDVHGAAEWALRRWNQADRLKQSGGRAGEPSDGRRRWYVDRAGHTMVVVPGPVTFIQGAPLSVTDREANEGPVKMWIGRTFAIADKEVSRAQFERFLQARSTLRGTPLNPQVRSAGPPDSPVKVNWHEAAAYCRWLSEQEGIAEDQMCYPPWDQPKKALNPYPDYLSRMGYRMPSEAEWEYACLAGAVTVFSFGHSSDLLNHYGWNHNNTEYAVQPVGLLKPNDLGLFDMHGGVWEWCFDSYYHRDRIQPVLNRQPDLLTTHEDIEDRRPVTNDAGRITRGGSFYDRPVYARAFVRNPAPPWVDAAGLRPARTLKPNDPAAKPAK